MEVVSFVAYGAFLRLFFAPLSILWRLGTPVNVGPERPGKEKSLTLKVPPSSPWP
jgi:hypothetical protein